MARSSLREIRGPEARVPVGYKAIECAGGGCKDGGYIAGTRRFDMGQPLRRT